jgi:hypothetical protein
MTDAKGRGAPVATRITTPGGFGGGIRRKIPAPFARPSISVGESGPRRVWQNVPADKLKAGDVVPGVGCIVKVDEFYHMPTAEEARAIPLAQLPEHHQWTVTVTGIEGAIRTYQGGEPVFAFALPVEEGCTT